MFHQEFFPTPAHVLDMMRLDCTGKVILEPHAGKGDIVDYCITHGAKQVIACEINEDLQKIVRSKAEIIGSDFFNVTAEHISHVDAIIMNPPFSNADRHILHAWKNAPGGCEIVSLCNYQTIANRHMYRQLANVIDDYGTAENLGDCFSNAERKTNVEVGLIRLYKPVNDKDYDFDGFFMDEDEEELQGEGIMPHNEVRSLVNRYVGIMKGFDTLNAEVQMMNGLTAGIGVSAIKMELGYHESITDKASFSKIIQKRSWQHIFRKMNMQKYVTSGVMNDVNKFVETQEKYPFTMKNIYKMFEIIVGTREHTYKRALEEAIENFTRHTHENRFDVEGWKTNSGHMLNKKFIVQGIIGTNSYDRFEPAYDSYGGKKIDDLVKVLCNLTATNYDSIGTLYRFNYGPDHKAKYDIVPNTWYEWGFFDVKFFKKGTMHVKFRNVNDWYVINKAYGELKGFALPETYKK